MRRAACLALAGICAVSWAVAGDAIYYRRDADGTLVLTNVPDSSDLRVLPGHAPSSGRRRGDSFQEVIRRTALQHGLHPELVSAVVAVESNYDPYALSPKGAQGLMQLMPATARRFGVADPFDPADNVRGGVRYLRHLLDLFEGDKRLALAAYNAGENAVLARGGVPPFRETRNYVRQVLRRFGAGRAPYADQEGHGRSTSPPDDQLGRGSGVAAARSATPR